MNRTGCLYSKMLACMSTQALSWTGLDLWDDIRTFWELSHKAVSSFVFFLFLTEQPFKMDTVTEEKHGTKMTP